MVHEEQGALRKRGAGAEYAVHPGRGCFPSEDQPVHRRGCAALRRLALANLPRQPGHKPPFLRVVPRDVRVDGPAEQLPGGGHRASLVRKGRYKTAHRPNPLGGGISNVGWTMTFAVFVIKGGKGSRPLCATKT